MTRGEAGAWRNSLTTQLFDRNSHVPPPVPDTRNRAVGRKFLHLVILDVPRAPHTRRASGSPVFAAASQRPAVPPPQRPAVPRPELASTRLVHRPHRRATD